MLRKSLSLHIFTTALLLVLHLISCGFLFFLICVRGFDLGQCFLKTSCVCIIGLSEVYSSISFSTPLHCSNIMCLHYLTLGLSSCLLNNVFLLFFLLSVHLIAVTSLSIIIVLKVFMQGTLYYPSNYSCFPFSFVYFSTSIHLGGLHSWRCIFMFSLFSLAG